MDDAGGGGGDYRKDPPPPDNLVLVKQNMKCVFGIFLGKLLIANPSSSSIQLCFHKDFSTYTVYASVT